MRLFVSVDLEDLADGVAAAQAPFRDLPGLRPTDPADAHVTLKFLGEGSHDRSSLVEALARAVERADVAPFDATFAGLGVFPSMSYIRVVWLGVTDGSDDLRALQDAVEAETTALGYPPADHEFTPHVTLARMDHAAAKDAVQAAVRSGDPTAGTLHVEEVRLTESVPTDDGPRYETRARFPIG